MVHELDVSVGKLVKSLSDKKMLENTIIVFSSDNGGPADGFNQNAASNWPLKGVACLSFYCTRIEFYHLSFIRLTGKKYTLGRWCPSCRLNMVAFDPA